MAEPVARWWARAGRASLSLGVACAGAALAALIPASCLELRDTTAVDPDVARCTSCHGDAEREGDYLLRAAPPYDLLRQTSSAYPGVGAHQIHLNASATHAALACEECHVVPESVEAPGHADDGPPGDVQFGVLASQGGRSPAYDPETRTCTDSYCHRGAWPVWSEPRDSSEACGTCHGLPPAPPHPQSEQCSSCHAEVIDSERHFIAPERHVDGIVDYAPGACQQCHGSRNNAAPPLDTSGNSAVSALGVGAHQVHLSGGAQGRPLACGECHRVPEDIAEPTHIDGLPAEVTFSGPALALGHGAHWDAAQASCSGSWCHTPSPGDTRSSPAWNVEQELTCTSCHGLPPPLPHPQVAECSVCHGAVVGADNRSIIDKNRHVDGTVDVLLDAPCNACHGGANAAPPADLQGNSDTSFAGVGAHQAHVQGTPRSRPVPCNECHLVPVTLLAPGHLDSAAPAELVFSGVALAQGASPVYEQGSCRATSCHGDVFPGGHLSGGAHTVPAWAVVDGTQAACGTCHGLPPPPPHPNDTFPCHQCHADLGDDDVTFVHPELHVDGIVTLQLE
jgi:predicted CxxxxCH...CXXCH cytochrome family protein